MKETKITKGNVFYYKDTFGSISFGMRMKWKNICITHKQTCQRWLGFLVEIINSPELYSLRNNFNSKVIKKIH